MDAHLSASITRIVPDDVLSGRQMLDEDQRSCAPPAYF